MKRHVRSAAPDETVQSAARTMREANVGLLPICEADGRVVGVVTDRDIALRICAERIAPSTTTVIEIMTAAVIACRPEDPVARAEALMKAHRITRVLVTADDGGLCGVISLSDLVFYEPPARIGRTLRSVAERKYEPDGRP